MTHRRVPLVEGEYFHIYNRGNSKQDIFLDEQDRSRFIKLLFLCNSEKRINFRDDIVDKGIDAWDYERGESLVSLGAWVLMSNHFHLYIKTRSSHENVPEGKKEETGVSEFMRKLSTGYASYFNRKYKRTGSLFEGRFKSSHVANDVQAKYLFSYIHLNPLKLIDPGWKEKGVKRVRDGKRFLEEYAWSSYFDHWGIARKEEAILCTEDFPAYFWDTQKFEEEIFGWLEKS